MKRHSAEGIRFGVLLLIAGYLILAGCQKDDPVPTAPKNTSPFTDDDVANMIGTSLADSAATYGLTAHILAAASVATSGHLASAARTSSIGSVLFDTTFTRHRSAGGYNYNFAVRYSYNYIPFKDSLIFDVVSMGTYNTPRLSGIDTSSAHILVSYIMRPDSQLLVNLSYSKYGYQTSKLGKQPTFYSDVTIDLVDVKISKSSKQITSGAGSIVLTEYPAEGESVDYTGDILFLGNQLATITLNDITYDVDLNTAATTRLH